MTNSVNFPMVPENLEKITSTDIKDKKVSLLLKEMLENIAKNININSVRVLTDKDIRLKIDNLALHINLEHNKFTIHAWSTLFFPECSSKGPAFEFPSIPPIFSENVTPHPEIKECFDNMQAILNRRMFQHSLYAFSVIYECAQPKKN